MQALPETRASGPEHWHFAALFASTIARPVDHALVTAYPGTPLTEAPLAALVRHPAFRRPVNRALSRQLRLSETEITSDLLARIGTSRATRVCVLLVTQPLALLREAAGTLGAVILHRDIVRIVMRADRDRVRAVLGEADFQVATHEAVLLHAPLAALRPADTAAVLDPGLDTAAAAGALAGLGLNALASFVDLIEPALASLLRRRIVTVLPDLALAQTALITAEHGDHIMRLLRRRIAAWSALIG